MYLALNANPCNPNSKLLRLSFEIFSHASRSRHQHWFGERGYASHAVLSPLLIQVFFAAGWQQLLAVLLAWLHHCRPLFSNHCEKQRAQCGNRGKRPSFGSFTVHVLVLNRSPTASL